MDLFLHDHEHGYHLTKNERISLYVSGIPYAKRHWDLARKTGKLGHYAIALIEFFPLIGAIAAHIEKKAAEKFKMMSAKDLPQSVAKPSELSQKPIGVESKPLVKLMPDSSIKLKGGVEIGVLSPISEPRDLIGELIKHGSYLADPEDTKSPSNELIGIVQGNRATRRLYLEILQSGIDLFSEEVLARIKQENRLLYEIILVKAYGHIKSKTGYKGYINLEGSCEALSMLMLAHSIKKLRAEFLEGMIELSSFSNFAERSEIEDTLLYQYFLKNTFYEIGLILKNNPEKNFNDELLNYLRQTESKLRICENVLRQSITAESSDEEIQRAYERIKRDEFQLVCSGFDWHSETLIYSDRYVVYHNRGALREGKREIHINTSNSKYSDIATLRELSNRFLRRNVDYRGPSPSPVIHLLNSKAPLNRIRHRPLKISKNGHCTHAAPKAAMYSLLALQEDRELNSFAYITAEQIYKPFTALHREYFEDIFRKNPLEGMP